MFTGLIEEIGRIQRIEAYGGGSRITIAADEVLRDLKVGDSVAINGICLTVVARTETAFQVEAVAETLQRSTLGTLQRGDAVNLERALQASSRLGGHFVQGHVDGIGEVISLTMKDPGYWLEIRLAEELHPFVVEKGSIAIDGVSLTIAQVETDRIAIALIPHSAQATTLSSKKSGDKVNIECDIIAKYVGRYLGLRKKETNISDELLRQWGY